MKHTNVNNYVQYPFEYFLAAILFVFKIHEVDPQKRSKIKLVHWYTQLYSIITDYNMANETDRAWVWDVLNTFENSINNNDDPHVAAQEVFDMYMAQTFSEKTLAHINYRKRSNVQDNVGCFALSYDTYYKKGNVLRLQFVPIREGLNHLQSNT